MRSVKGEPLPLSSYFVIELTPKLATKKLSAWARRSEAQERGGDGQGALEFHK